MNAGFGRASFKFVLRFRPRLIFGVSRNRQLRSLGATQDRQSSARNRSFRTASFGVLTPRCSHSRTFVTVNV
jgi:hypothetical protein